MTRRLPFTAAALIAMALLTAPAAASTAELGCQGQFGVVWEHIADDGTADLVTLACGGTARPLTHTPPGEGGSELPRWNGRGSVHFDSDRAGLVHVFRLSPVHPQRVTQITVTNGVEFAPTPIGHRLVFEHAALDGSGDGLFIAPDRPGVHASAFRRLTLSPTAGSGGFDTSPDVSPDGRTVAFVRVSDTTPGAVKSAVFTIGIDGGELRQLTPFSLNAINPRWSPDGRRLLFSSNGDNFSDTVSAEVYVVGRTGQGRTQLTYDPAGSHSFTPAWAPDGSHFVYAHARPGLPGVQLRVRSLLGTRSTLLYQGTAGTEQDPDWR